MDPPMFPSILGNIVLQGMLVMAVGLLGMIINQVYVIYFMLFIFSVSNGMVE